MAFEKNPLGPPRDRFDIACQKLASRFLGHEGLGSEIAFKLRLATRMSDGADAHGRSAIRRDKLESAAKAAQRLLDHLADFTPQTIADALGRVAPVPVGVEMTDEEIFASAVPSRAPALLANHDVMIGQLQRLKSGLTALADRPSIIKRGRDDTPDSLMFAVEGLAALWRQHKSVTIIVVSRKGGGFGDFVVQALKLCSHRYISSQVDTALRRLQEAQPSKG